MSQPTRVHAVLWTGGWDSTYRVLDLLLLKRREVQPYYVIDLGRASYPMEIRTLRVLRDAILDRCPECRDRLRPTSIRAKDEYPAREAHSEHVLELRRAHGHMGWQYEWLARVAEAEELTDLELSIHRDDWARRALEAEVTEEDDGLDHWYRLRDSPSMPYLELFRRYRFPLFDLTKLDMQRAAAEHGFGGIMEQTWFCHSPLRGGKPCGVCPPCRYTWEEGLGRRIPPRSRARYYSVYPLRACWRRLNNKLGRLRHQAV